MRVLGIETTCDETAAAVVELHPDGRREILSNEVLSQIAEHAPFGGVVPEIAARAHVESLDRLVMRALRHAKVELADLDGIAAAAGPGLIGGVIVGLTTAKTLALVAHKPFLAVNHLEAHALTARLVEDVAFPYLLLLASGGHSALVAVRDIDDYVRLGSTIDDAIGEAFDKVAKLLGLGNPGGPQVEKLARLGDPARFKFPKPLLKEDRLDFSFSGLKTAVRLMAEQHAPLDDQTVADICASFQRTVAEIVATRAKAALERYRAELPGRDPVLVVAGGVAANKTIGAALNAAVAASGARLVVPPIPLCTDNGAMVAWAGAERLALGAIDTLNFSAKARWPLDSADMGLSHHGT
jgi:N6-L-threonylcarbamoyladenine synthase